MIAGGVTSTTVTVVLQSVKLPDGSVTRSTIVLAPTWLQFRLRNVKVLPLLDGNGGVFNPVFGILNVNAFGPKPQASLLNIHGLAVGVVVPLPATPFLLPSNCDGTKVAWPDAFKLIVTL